MAFVKGYLAGLVFIVFMGPAMLTLIKASITHGFWSGWMVAFGIFSGDVLAVFLVYNLGATRLVENQLIQIILAFLGAALLLIMGFRYAIKPSLHNPDEVQVSTLSYLGFFAKGFFLNFLNPFVFVVWIGMLAIATQQYSAPKDVSAYMAGLLGMVITSDTLRAAFAHKIRPLFQPHILIWIFRVIGVVLIGFGIYLLMVGIDKVKPI